MKTIYKFPIPSFWSIVAMPIGSTPFKAGLQLDESYLWAHVDDEQPMQAYEVRIFGTGEAIPEGYIYFDTLFDGPFVWHYHYRTMA